MDVTGNRGLLCLYPDNICVLFSYGLIITLIGLMWYVQR